MMKAFCIAIAPKRVYEKDVSLNIKAFCIAIALKKMICKGCFFEYIVGG